MHLLENIKGDLINIPKQHCIIYISFTPKLALYSAVPKPCSHSPLKKLSLNLLPIQSFTFSTSFYFFLLLYSGLIIICCKFHNLSLKIILKDKLTEMNRGRVKMTGKNLNKVSFLLLVESVPLCEERLMCWTNVSMQWSSFVGILDTWKVMSLKFKTNEPSKNILTKRKIRSREEKNL